jgi:hypothetical protein
MTLLGVGIFLGPFFLAALYLVKLSSLIVVVDVFMISD